MLGIPLLQNKKCLGFLVFWFIGFNVSWFLRFLVSKFLLGFKISKIFMLVETDLHDCAAPVFSQDLKSCVFPKNEMSENNISENRSGFRLEMLVVSSRLSIKIIVVRGAMDTSEKTQIM